MIYTFGSFKIDTKTRQFFCLDQAVSIQPRVYQLLLLLISHRDQALDKNTIQDEIWPNQILSETSLSRLIMKARKALNDNPDKPTYIKTLHGFGFQFIATVTETNDQNSLNQEKDKNHNSSNNLPNRKTNIKIIAFFAFSFALLAIVVGVYFPNEATSSKPRVLILPVINEIEDKSYHWISLGLPSLVKTMLEQSTDYNVIDMKRLSKYKFDNATKQQISNELIVSLRKEFSVDQILYSKIKKQGDQFAITFSIHENTTQTNTYQSVSSEPSQLAKKMAEKLVDTKSTEKELTFEYTISESSFVNTLYGKGQSLLLQGHTQKARDIFKVAMSEDPNLFWPRYSFSLTSRKLGLWEEAKIELIELLKHPNLKKIKHAESRSRNILGFTYYRLREYKKALAQYDIAYQLSELEKDFQLQAGIADNVGGIHWFNYNFDEARIWLTRAITKRKESGLKPTGHAFNLLGLLERDQGNLLNAKSQLTKSAKLFFESKMIRDYTMVQINLTTIDEHLGDFDQALSRLNESQTTFSELKEKEGQNFLHRRFASIYLAKGNNNLARKHLDIAMNHAKDLGSEMRIALTKFILGKIYLAENDLKNAETNLSKILNHHDEVWAPYLPFIELAILKKDKNEFEQFFTKAIKDADDKNDRLSKFYAEASYQRNKNIFEKNNQLVIKNLLEIINQARAVNANRLLGEHLIVIVNQFISEKDFDSALAQFQQLELLFPQWQLTQSLKLKLNYFQYKNLTLLEEIKLFKIEHTDTWSKEEENWFNEMKSL